jgi:hypothetical protein
MAEPLEAQVIGEEGGEGSGSGDRGIVAGLLGENLKMVRESHRETLLALTGQVATRRWLLRSVTGAVVVLAAAVGGVGWYLSQARAQADERAGQVVAAGVRIDQMGMEIVSVSDRADRLEAGLREAVAAREGLGGRLVEMVAVKGRLELLVSQGVDERAGKDRLILEMAGRIAELEGRISEYEGRIVVASDIGKDN